jgi:uncharacterized spore protein YtfJ
MIYVVTETLSIWSHSGLIFGVLVSPVALIVFEEDQSYAISMTEEKNVSIESLIAREPSLREKLQAI